MGLTLGLQQIAHKLFDQNPIHWHSNSKKILSLAVTSHTRERVNQDIFLDGEFAEEGEGLTISKYKWGVARSDRFRFGPGLAKREFMSNKSQTMRLRKYDPEPFYLADIQRNS